MATKWNNTNDEKAPGKGHGVKAALSALAFFLGLTLLLSSAASVAQQLLWERDPVPWRTDDWQATESFQSAVSSSLRSFLRLGAGGGLTWYDENYWAEYEDRVMNEVIVQEGGWGWVTDTAIAEAQPATSDVGIPQEAGSDTPTASPADAKDADLAFRGDKNLLYYIAGGAGKDRREYTNAPGGKDFFTRRDNGDYNFYLTFEGGKAAIEKDGKALDVYGDGVYTGANGQWFLPGYDNFPAGEQLRDVTVCMAVRRTPAQYYSVDSRSGTYGESGMYNLARWHENSRQYYLRQTALLAAGTLLLLLWIPLRRDKKRADRKIAAWTVHVWTEFRFLAVLSCVLGLLLPGLKNTDLFWALRYSWEYESGWYGANVGLSLLRVVFSSVPALVGLVWTCWLIHNDHRYNPREGRRGLFRRVRARDLQRPVERRLGRIQAAGMAALALVLAAAVVLTSAAMGNDWYPALILLVPLLVGVVCLLVSAWKSLGLAQDLGRLADQVEKVRAGDLTHPLDLPQDADLRRTAESLNDIQAGMKAALAEQTRSERMKVELVSNVSHDLKTPLTSILSYAELLRQEELPPAAADYARIIDEKARRLKTMVQDVFDISKAAADQLPVHLERLDLGKLLRQTLADLEQPIRESGLTFRTELPEEPVMVVADGRRLYRVFQNLIDNALRYALAGSRVYLRLETAEALARASVRNTSRTELLEGVDFTARFVRGDASRTDGGSGLGLSIARSFTEACGGAFRVETVADLFTAVVELPLAGEEA